MKWEYRIAIIPLSEIEDAHSLLNREGREGWELVTLIPRVGKSESWSQAFFKRQLPN